MSDSRRLAALTVAAAMCVASGALSAGVAQAGSYRSCKPVSNPYPGTRYAGVDLSRIRALDVSCPTARQVARGAHRKALGITPPPSGIRSFKWRGWKVTGNLRGDHDRYIARRPGGGRVRWLF